MQNKNAQKNKGQCNLNHRFWFWPKVHFGWGAFPSPGLNNHAEVFGFNAKHLFSGCATENGVDCPPRGCNTDNRPALVDLRAVPYDFRTCPWGEAKAVRWTLTRWYFWKSSVLDVLHLFTHHCDSLEHGRSMWLGRGDTRVVVSRAVHSGQLGDFTGCEEVSSPVQRSQGQTIGDCSHSECVRSAHEKCILSEFYTCQFAVWVQTELLCSGLPKTDIATSSCGFTGRHWVQPVCDHGLGEHSARICAAWIFRVLWTRDVMLHFSTDDASRWPEWCFHAHFLDLAGNWQHWVSSSTWLKEKTRVLSQTCIGFCCKTVVLQPVSEILCSMQLLCTDKLGSVPFLARVWTIWSSVQIGRIEIVLSRKLGTTKAAKQN